MSQDETEARKLIDSLGSRYDKVERIAAGGMGVVFRAEDTILLRLVAIKVLLSNHADEHLVRFQQEARACSRLKHHNLISVLDFGVGPTGHPYLIMDFVDGKSLDRAIGEKGPLPLEMAIPIIKGICEGMEHAHQSSVIHRDLKPSNIMLATDKSGAESVKVLDFGIARLTDRRGTGKIITTEGAALGTPAYMSPEQISGSAVDHRSDIYSVGCVMFKTLTGRAPFRSSDSLVVMKQHLQAPPPLLKAASQKEFPPELERITEK
ncbi:MAG: serine/threonine protein kinase [Cyanobacteria bacterium]|nr:serine/threonine protein kinase [Cyanobacteriota bacterium]